MTEPTYTLKEVAAIVSQTGTATEDIARTARQIRHWTLLDLLEPEGPKHTGTGVSRQYPLAEVYKAALLIELSRWHLPMTILADGFSALIDKYGDSDEWRRTVEGLESVYLEVAWSEDLTVWKVSPGAPSLYLLKERKTTTNSPFKEPASAIVVNLTKLFRRLNVSNGKRKEKSGR